jgi:hypothetical protein
LENENIERNLILSVDLDEIDPGADPHSLVDETMRKIKELELKGEKRKMITNRSLSTIENNTSDDEDEEESTEEHDDDKDVII